MKPRPHPRLLAKPLAQLLALDNKPSCANALRIRATIWRTWDEWSAEKGKVVDLDNFDEYSVKEDDWLTEMAGQAFKIATGISLVFAAAYTVFSSDVKLDSNFIRIENSLELLEGYKPALEEPEYCDSVGEGEGREYVALGKPFTKFF